ncbi:hypothetical protein QE418_000577 [Microbacterium testaceum]|uniref:hypothetical protein n=1 Tax=Microbacterium TaxID=33882 RepID=UPI0027814D5F|nr:MULTISPECIES: hypothetical protein [Microbacterium]MDQ1111129.1 hypothetical protein [Microbacterium testaceum]MDR6098332.1 hypothetical protein [Microbacterium sp. SORGH_AS_0454]
MQRVFATVADYTKYAEEDYGDDALLTKRLRSASVEVEKLIRGAVYDVDDDGYPTDADTADALAEATCAIVEHWADTDDPRGTDAVQGAVKIGSVSLGTTSSGSDNLSASEKLARRIGDKAVDILTNAGMIGSAVAHW